MLHYLEFLHVTHPPNTYSHTCSTFPSLSASVPLGESRSFYLHPAMNVDEMALIVEAVEAVD